MATLLEMASEIVSSHASTSAMTTDELLQEIQKVYTALKKLEVSEGIIVEVEEPQKVTISVKDAFKKNEVICMVCGKGGMKTLARHLAKSHDLKPGEYRKQYGIPRTQALAAKAFSESRRQMAMERGLADNLAKAREVRAAKLKEKKATPTKATKRKATPKSKK
ncbi:MAG: MucR family transcriptional [Geobacteraceae bacterium]|nr:MAG: MucR family transcriptional [Geobacteraceae bacterium]